MIDKSPLNLSRFYVLALTLLAILMSLSYALTEFLIHQKKDDATIINISAEQRTLSQRLSVLLLEYALAENETERTKIKQSLEQHSNRLIESHRFLTGKQNAVELDSLSRDVINEIAQMRLSPRIKEMYFEEQHPYEGGRFMTLDRYVEHYVEEIEEILEIPVNELTPFHPEIRHIIEYYPHTLLRLLDDIVFQYETESRQKNNNLSQLTLGIYIFTLLFIVGLGIFIFRPMERGVVKYAKKLRETNEAKITAQRLAVIGDMAGRMAHEINNALQPALGMTDILHSRLSKLEPKLCELTEESKKSIIRAKTIIDDVLSFAGMNHMETRRISLQKGLEKSLKNIETSLPESISLFYNLHSVWSNDPKTCITVNEERLQSAITSLIQNAAEAMDNKGTIEIQTDSVIIAENAAEELVLQPGEYLEISIIDEGKGIDNKVRETMFEPFISTKPNQHGTGMGLSMALGIISEFGGTITAEPNKNVGSCFKILLPLTRENG